MFLLVFATFGYVPFDPCFYTDGRWMFRPVLGPVPPRRLSTQRIEITRTQQWFVIGRRRT